MDWYSQEIDQLGLGTLTSGAVIRRRFRWTAAGRSGSYSTGQHRQGRAPYR